jgi:hypothetical protein
MPIWTDRVSTIVSFKRMRLDNGTIEVPLTRAEIGDIITDVSELVVANGVAAAAPVLAVTLNRRLANNGVFTASQVNVQNPTTANQWITELRTNAAGALAAPKYYRFGDWVVQLEHGDGYYMEVHGSVGANTSFGTWNPVTNIWSLGSTYADIVRNGHFDSAAAASQIRSWLQGHAVAAATPGTANVALAMFVSESTRNYRTWLINLMCLDLIQAGKLEWVYLPDRYHPMARGGTYTRGATGMAGGQKDADTARIEINITMEWLEHRKLPRVWMWPDDQAVGARELEHVNAASGIVKNELLGRARSLRKL